MTIVHLVGLDGSNPLHMLAALGALLLSDDLAPNSAALGWTRAGGRYVPRLDIPMEPDAWTRAIAERVQWAASVTPAEGRAEAQRRVQRLKKEEKTLSAAVKATKAEANRLGLRGSAAKAFVSEQSAEAESRRAFAARERQAAEVEVATALGFGPAHLGDSIGVSADVFRAQVHHAQAEGSNNRTTLRQLSVLASDGCLKEDKVEPTPFSFSNGSSGQLLLKDFRALAEVCTAAKIDASLLRAAPIIEPRTNLNWDPAAHRSAAYQWSDPEKQPKETDVATNAIAYFGLGILPCFPGRRGLTAVAFDHGFTWPIWEPLLNVGVVGALLAQTLDSSEPEYRYAREARGILVTFRSERINPDGKRYYFAPSRAV
jgi:hypothetical protein